MKDGLYIVNRGSIYGAFVVRHGEICSCAPVLRKNLNYYKTIAEFVPTAGDPLEPDEREQLVTVGDDYPPPWHAGME